MRRASWRWLSPDFWRNMRIEAAICRCVWGPATGSGGGGVIRMGSGSSSSSEVLHFLQRWLLVRNWTRWQWSQRTTSRESTGARVVAMYVLGVPELAMLQKITARSSNFG